MMNRLSRLAVFVAGSTLMACSGTTAPVDDEIAVDSEELAAPVTDLSASRVRSFEGRGYGDSRAVTTGSALAAGVRAMVNEAAKADRSVNDVVNRLGPSLYTSTATVLPPLATGTGWTAMGGLLTYLKDAGTPLRVRKLCDIIGVSSGSNERVWEFTNIAERGAGTAPLLEVERMRAVRGQNGQWRIQEHAFAIPFGSPGSEVEGVASCIDSRAVDARRASCQRTGIGGC